MNALLELRNKSGLSQQIVADYLGMSRANYTNIENGKRGITQENALKLAEFFKVSTDVILGGDSPAEFGDLNIPGSIRINENRRIPVLGRVPAGIPIEAIENIEGYVYISEDLYSNKEVFGLQVIGDSMSPDIQEGDIAIILQTPVIETSGLIYVVRINGDDVTLKKVVKTDMGLDLIPLNPKYGAMKYTAEQVHNLPIEIVGIAVEIRRSLNKNKKNGKQIG